MKKDRGFTLAEIMIVLTIIGILTAILLPVAFQSAPDENLLKLKKANKVIDEAIGELLASEKYYLNGDLGVKPDGSLVDWDNEENYTYFCDTLAEVLSTKEKKCSKANTPSGGSVQTYIDGVDNLENALLEMDSDCKENAKAVGAEIITTDNITYYQGGPNRTFGSVTGIGMKERNFGAGGYYENEISIDSSYKVFCVDVDGIHKNATKDDCVNECPFGFGIRADGKVIAGARANEWLEKTNDK